MIHPSFKKYRNSQKLITMVTCYDFWSAKLLADSPMDWLLVGDSVAMVVHGFDSTLPATMEMMQLHTAAVARGAPKKFIVADLPFLQHRIGVKAATKAAGQLLVAGAHAVKIEGCDGHLKTIQYIVESGIPIIGHLGLTPQSINAFGGYKVQGRAEEAGKKIFADAKALEQAGCSALVLECVPAKLAQTITNECQIPIIGIGAGPDTDGQVLVLHDLLGFNTEFKPKFLRHFAEGDKFLSQAINSYYDSVQAKSFPNEMESYL